MVALPRAPLQANSGVSNHLFRNTGADFIKVTSTVVDDSTMISRGAAWGDVNGDGWLDLYVCNEGQDELFLNDGTGAFTRLPTAPTDNRLTSTSAAFADVTCARLEPAARAHVTWPR